MVLYKLTFTYLLSYLLTCVAVCVYVRLVSLLVLFFEAPICCQFFDCAKTLSDFADRRSFLQKALIYVGCVSTSNIF